jgi:hypothetical protein
MNMKRRLIFLGALIALLSFSAGAQASEICDWWACQTSNSNVFLSGIWGVRLANAYSGSISGTVTLPSASEWQIDFSVGTDEDVNRSKSDYVDVYVNGAHLGRTYNDPAETWFPYSVQIAGSSFTYEFDFVSSNTDSYRHEYIPSGYASLVPEPAALALWGAGAVMFLLRRK